jgi:hypothetical protein
MAVAAVNLVLEKGTDFSATFNVSGPDNGPVSLVDYVAVSKIRKYPTAIKSKSFEAEVFGDVSNPSIKVSMGRSDTSELSSGRNCFDVLLVDINTGHTVKVVEGSIIVSDSVSI